MLFLVHGLLVVQTAEVTAFPKEGDAKPKIDFGLNVMNIVRDCRVLEAVEIMKLISCR